LTVRIKYVRACRALREVAHLVRQHARPAGAGLKAASSGVPIVQREIRLDEQAARAAAKAGRRR